MKDRKWEQQLIFRRWILILPDAIFHNWYAVNCDGQLFWFRVLVTAITGANRISAIPHGAAPKMAQAKISGNVLQFRRWFQLIDYNPIGCSEWLLHHALNDLSTACSSGNGSFERRSQSDEIHDHETVSRRAISFPYDAEAAWKAMEWVVSCVGTAERFASNKQYIC